MACARPVVATTAGGIPEIVEDGVTGTLVPPDDVAALATALENLHRRADRAWRLGEAAAEVARERYSWHAVVDGFELVYDEVLGLATVTPEGALPRATSRREGRGR
jgi:starch synthase